MDGLVWVEQVSIVRLVCFRVSQHDSFILVGMGEYGLINISQRVYCLIGMGRMSSYGQINIGYTV